MSMQSSIPVQSIVGPVPGPTLTITILMHGDETCGLHVRDFLIAPTFRLKRGRVNLVMLNKEASLTEDGPRRFLNYDLNRLWGNEELPGSYEGRRVEEIVPLLAKSDAILDIHSMPEDGRTFTLISDERPRAFELARLLAPAISRIVVAPAPNNRGRALFQTTRLPQSLPIAVIECGQHHSAEAGVVACSAARAFLSGYEMVEVDECPQPLPDSRYYLVETEYRTEHGAISFVGCVDQFEPLAEGQIFALDGTQPLFAKRGQSLLLKRRADKSGEEAFTLVRELSAHEIERLFNCQMK